MTEPNMRAIFGSGVHQLNPKYPTGNPKYPDSPIGYCEDSDSLHECGRDRSVVGIHECGLHGCHLPSDSVDVA